VLSLFFVIDLNAIPIEVSSENSRIDFSSGSDSLDEQLRVHHFLQQPKRGN